MRRDNTAVATSLIVLILVSAAGAEQPGPPSPSGKPALSQSEREEIWRIEKRCASNSLYLFLRMHRKARPYEDVEKHIPLTENGANLADMRRCVAALGLPAKVVKVTPDYLKRCPLPVIAHMESEANSGPMGHYVVVTSVGPKGVELIDGTTAAIDLMPMEKFAKMWSGYLLVTETSAGGMNKLSIGATLLGALTVGLALVTTTRRRPSGH